jgi:hypothetical protein
MEKIRSRLSCISGQFTKAIRAIDALDVGTKSQLLHDGAERLVVAHENLTSAGHVCGLEVLKLRWISDLYLLRLVGRLRDVAGL